MFRTGVRRAAIAAAILALAVPASAFAVTSQSSSSETLTVTQAAALTISGLPTSIDLGAALPGQTTPDVHVGDITITPLGGVTTWAVTLSQTPLASGPNSIPASSSAWSFDKGGGYLPFVSYPISGNVFDSSFGLSTFGMKTHWTIPAAAVAGAYTGTLTVMASGS
jgi:hypothetical protein